MSSMKSKKIVLIGGAGFIGHHLALKLHALGANVAIVDSLQVNNLVSLLTSTNPVPHKGFYVKVIESRLAMLREAGIELHTVDARDYGALSLALGKIRPEVVVHLAAVAHADRSNKDPFSTFDHNLRTLENALDFSRGTDVSRFVFFSSSMVYGKFPDGFVTEDTPCNPLGIYGALKFSGEKLVIAYNQVFKLPYTILRPSALYGPRCVSRRVGQIFIENALLEGEISVNGDGSDRLDFTYVDDLVNGVTLAIERDEAKNEIFNVTFGQSRSIAEMIDILKQNFPEAAVKFLERDVLMPERGTLSIEKAQRLLGYEPQYPLEKGFAAYLEWYRQFTAGRKLHDFD